MTDVVNERVARLIDEESRLVLDSFDHAAAWQLGTMMVEKAIREIAPVIIDIRVPGMVLFHSAQAGTTAENEIWLKRKARTTFRFETSTALLEARFKAQGIDQWTTGWFDTRRFTATGGCIPLRVRGVGVVAAATISGLSSSDADQRNTSPSRVSALTSAARPRHEAVVTVAGADVLRPTNQSGRSLVMSGSGSGPVGVGFIGTGMISDTWTWTTWPRSPTSGCDPR